MRILLFFLLSFSDLSQDPIRIVIKNTEGNFIPGPAIIESFGSSSVVFPKQEARVDRFGNLLLVTKADLTKQTQRAGRATGLHGVGAA